MPRLAEYFGMNDDESVDEFDRDYVRIQVLPSFAGIGGGVCVLILKMNVTI